MNASLSSFLLILTPLWPLLLAFPALRSWLKWPCYIALLPAFILLSVATDVTVNLPWLLFGSGLGLDGVGRFLLAMSALLWVGAATRLPATIKKPTDEIRTSFFLLTLAGNLGAILATELVGFFAFSVLMGYGFYGLLVAGGNKATRSAARLYLVLLILTDLALFEALLIAASMTADPHFATLQQTTTVSPASTLYLSMVLIGFAARAAIWPLHFWLPRVFASAQPEAVLLLAGVPVAVALLGIVRWLPLGEISATGPGLVMLGLGAAAMLYAIFTGLRRTQRCRPAASVVIFASGLFAAAVGMGLTDPAAWQRYEHFVYVFIACLGPAVAALIVISKRLQKKLPYPIAKEQQRDNSKLWLELYLAKILRRLTQTATDTLPSLRSAWRTKIKHFWPTGVWQRILYRCEHSLQRWSYAIILFLLLAIITALLGAAF
jgi:formate hydrogenlyase subunit 3/multisubunit Na+/H+ antiporter MnhD subunit